MTASHDPRLDEPLTLPDAPAPARPPRWPLLAALVPVVGGLTMWLVTGSAISLCFAALGPLMAVASVLDGRRGSRRERRRSEREHADACRRIEREISRRHERERAALRARDLDAAALLHDERRVWRADADELVVGLGAVGSSVRVTGGDGGERAEALRRAAAVLDDAPVAVAAEEGVCVRGDRATAMAVARALVVQLCLRASPSALALVAAPESESWAARLPHRTEDARAGTRRIAFLDLAAGRREELSADVVIAVAAKGGAIPETCGALLEIDGALRARLVRGPQTRELAPEALSLAQAAAIATQLAAREGASGVRGWDPPLSLSSLEPVAGAPGGASLPAVVGTSSGSPAVLDIVADGPHAVVVGTTGAGKSELLVTWIASLARTHTPERVVFLLADFKGGTAFEPLMRLPHVTGMITDLDAAASRRAVESLRAEIRRREERLTAAGSRDVSEPGVGLPRLVIVVDEFAAVLQEHPDLHAVFSDVAARGRALGMHLILGTQRATGVVRDALVANCPLRIALRVAERAESRGIVGCDDAAELPGGAEARGLALLRRAADTAPRLTRIALTPPEEIAALAASDGAPRPAGPWLPPLPAMLRLDELLTREPLADDGPAGGELAERGGGSRAVVLGLADDPDRQRQPLVTLRPGHDRGLLVVGAAGSGKSTVARLAAAQCPSAIVVPREAEAAWDAVARVEHETPRLFVVDDLDALLARFPHDYAQLLAERLETIVREAGERGMTVLLTAARVTGATARIADLLPRRAVLALATRADHAAAGGDGASFDPSRPPGRALLDGREVQFATPMGAAAESPSPLGLDASPVLWRPTAPVTALVVRSPHRRGLSLSAGWGEGVRVVLLDELEAGARLERVAASRGDRIVVAGDGESWQRQWMLLQDARSRVPMVVGAECAAELRALTGERELPPFARTRAGRAWLVADGHPPRRIVLPG